MLGIRWGGRDLTQIATLRVSARDPSPISGAGDRALTAVTRYRAQLSLALSLSSPCMTRAQCLSWTDLMPRFHKLFFWLKIGKNA